MGIMTKKEVIGRHTKGISEIASVNAGMFEEIVHTLDAEQKQLFEIAFANGYMEGQIDQQDNQADPVLKEYEEDIVHDDEFFNW